MQFLGNYRLGETVPLRAWTQDNSGTPTLPDVTPLADVFNGSTRVRTVQMPIHDRYETDAFFLFPLYLDGSFVAGEHAVLYTWVIGGTVFGEQAYFTITAGGNEDGAGISAYYFDTGHSDFLLYQGTGGRVLRRRHPRSS